MSNTLTMPNAATIATAGNNHAAMVPNSTVFMEQATLALSDYDKAKKLDGTATQRMAFAIMCQHIALAKGSKDLPTLAATIGSKEATKVVKDLMVTHLVSIPKITSETSDDARVKITAQKNAVGMLISRSLEFAAILARAGVSYDGFNIKDKLFNVPPRICIPANAKPLGRLAESTTVPVDGRGGLVIVTTPTGGEKTAPAYCSIAGILKMAKGPNKNGANNPSTASTTAGNEPVTPVMRKAVIDATSGTVLLRTALQKINDKAKADGLSMSDFSLDLRNAIAEFQRAYDAMRAKAEAATTKAKAQLSGPQPAHKPVQITALT